MTANEDSSPSNHTIQIETVDKWREMLLNTESIPAINNLQDIQHSNEICFTMKFSFFFHVQDNTTA
jgi:hypothetical protein